MYKPINRLFITLLALSLLFTSAYATDLSSPGNGVAKVQINQSATILNVTVPTSLPVTVNNNNEVSVASGIKIINSSFGPIKVSNAQIVNLNSWSLVDYTTDFKSSKVGLKQFGFQLQGSSVPNTGLCSLDNFATINGGEELPITYLAKTAVQPYTVTADVGSVVFTVSWDTTSSGAINNITDYYTFTLFRQSGLNSFLGCSWDDLEASGLAWSGYNISLTDSFKTALESNSGNGASYKDWNPGDPLPNPGSTYQSTVVDGAVAVFLMMNCKSLDLSLWDTSNIVNMSTMFGYCQSLTSLNLSSFNTSKVTNMSSMFKSCQDITELNLSAFNTSNVTNMSEMIDSCTNITTINLSSFNTLKVTDFSNMIFGCQYLSSIDLSTFDISDGSTTTSMFYMCTVLNTGYAKTQAEADKLNASSNKPAGLTFTVK